MSVFIWIGITLFLLVLFLIFPVITLEILLTRKKDDNQLIVTVSYLLPWIRFRFYVARAKSVETTHRHLGGDVQYLEKKDWDPQNQQTVWNVSQGLRIVTQDASTFLRIVKNLLQHLHFHKLRLKISFGTGEAASTGFLVGNFWAVLAFVLGGLTNLCHFHKNPQIQMTPEFDRRILTVKLHCIVKFRTGYAISTGAKLWWFARKVKKDLEKEQRLKVKRHGRRTSYSGTNEHSNG